MNATTNRPTTATHLGAYERELLETLGTGWSMPYGEREFSTPTVIVVWASQHEPGRIEVGRARSRSWNNLGEYVDASPFPGAWTQVRVANLMRVIHPSTL